MAEKLLRGKQPLTMWRGANGAAGGYLYRGGILEADRIDSEDRDRLVAENFLEYVVRDGEQFRLAEDTPTGSKGDPVAVGDNGLVPESEKAHDIGTTNSEVMSEAERQRRAEAEAQESEAAKAKADADVAAKRAEAQAKLPADGSLPDGRAGKDVWVEWLARNGYSYADASQVQDKAELVDLAKQVDADRKSKG